MNAYNIVYFDSFGVEHFPKEIEKFIANKNTLTNFYTIHGYNSVMCGYLYIRFIDFMLKVKSLLDYTNLFFPNDYGKNDKIRLNFFSITTKIEKLDWAICKKYRKFGKPKISYLSEKTLVISIIYKNEDKQNM